MAWTTCNWVLILPDDLSLLHTDVGNRKNKRENTRKAVGVNSSGAAGQPQTYFGQLKWDGVLQSAGVQSALPLPPALPGPKQFLVKPEFICLSLLFGVLHR